MNTVTRAPLIAVLLLVVLRISIGWQFLYEGLWKKDTLSTPDPWTSEGYLKNAQGPLRNYFREMTGDPDDLNWLDYAKVSEKWYDWRDRFVKHYQLTDAQQATLNNLLDGAATEDTAADQLPPSKTTVVELAALPAGVTVEKLKPIASYNAEKKQLSVSGPVLPSEEANLLGLAGVQRSSSGSLELKSEPGKAPTGDVLAYARSVDRLVSLSRQLSFRHKLAAQLRGNPEFVGVTGRKNDRGSFDIIMGTVTADQAGEASNNVVYGKIQEYKDLIKDYNANVNAAKMDYQTDHANMLGKKVAIMRSEIVGPIKALDKELRSASIALLTPEQLKHGAPPAAESPLARSDKQVMWGLIILGILLIIGLGTRVAAVLGAVMLMMFYMVIPPWPGVPQLPGPEHSFIVNKNMIEAIALLAIAALPTGSWFGIDALFSRFCCRRCNTVAQKPAVPGPQTTAPAPVK